MPHSGYALHIVIVAAAPISRTPSNLMKNEPQDFKMTANKLPKQKAGVISTRI